MLFTSESVSFGHPDKLADQIADSILDLCLLKDNYARVAVEVMINRDLIYITGEISSDKMALGLGNATLLISQHLETYFNFPKDVRRTIRLRNQSEEISTAMREDGAGDQCTVFGFACRDTPEYLPAPIYYANHLMEQHWLVHDVNLLKDDAKCQVTVKYDSVGIPEYIDTIVMSLSHVEEATQSEIENIAMYRIINKVIPATLLTEQTKYIINPSGKFIKSGIDSDTGLTGRKIMVDTYGGMARHGGGSFSGKDPSKLDRSGAYMARYIAKNIVAAGLAERCEVQLSYVIGVAKPIVINIETYGTNRISEDRLYALVIMYFDLTPKGIIEQLRLLNIHYLPLATFGHFGRNRLRLPWEQLNQVDNLRKASGLNITNPIFYF